MKGRTSRPVPRLQALLVVFVACVSLKEYWKESDPYPSQAGKRAPRTTQRQKIDHRYYQNCDTTAQSITLPSYRSCNKQG